MVMPGADLSGKALADLIVEERVSLAAGVPTIWMQVLPELEDAIRHVCGRFRVEGQQSRGSEGYREVTGLPLLKRGE